MIAIHHDAFFIVDVLLLLGFDNVRFLQTFQSERTFLGGTRKCGLHQSNPTESSPPENSDEFEIVQRQVLELPGDLFVTDRPELHLHGFREISIVFFLQLFQVADELQKRSISEEKNDTI